MIVDFFVMSFTHIRNIWALKLLTWVTGDRTWRVSPDEMEKMLFPSVSLVFTVPTFKNYPAQNQTTALHVQNDDGRCETWWENQSNNRGTAIFVFNSCRDCPRGSSRCKLTLRYLSLYHFDKAFCIKTSGKKKTHTEKFSQPELLLQWFIIVDFRVLVKD